MVGITIDTPFVDSVKPLGNRANKVPGKKDNNQLCIDFDDQIVGALTPSLMALDAKVTVLESIKIAYELAALEFGELYVAHSPMAQTLRLAINERSYNEEFFRAGMDLGPLESVMPGKDVHYFLLFQNTCIVSIFGMVSSIKYCLEEEPFICRAEEALLYVFEPASRSYSRQQLAEYLLHK